MLQSKVLVLGTRGIPAQHGGFETFAEYLALYLSQNNWHVTVYCQIDGKGKITRDTWQNIERVNIPIARPGALGTMIFDLIATAHSLTQRGLPLVLGYNTAVFGLLYRLIGRKHVINMDGIEWKRAKWGKLAKAWFYLNERIGCWVGNCLIADHPEIARHLATRVSPEKITMIPYGADHASAGDNSILSTLGIEPRQFALIVARPEPENSILEIVSAFSRSARGNHKLVVLGNFDAASNSYHKSVFDAAGENVIFPGAIYDKQKVAALRLNCSMYFHGHTVGGTNPALVEALGAGCAVVAHDNPFNRWVAGLGARFFGSATECDRIISELLATPTNLIAMRESSLLRHQEAFQWEGVLAQYERLLSECMSGNGSRRSNFVQ